MVREACVVVMIGVGVAACSSTDDPGDPSPRDGSIATSDAGADGGANCVTPRASDCDIAPYLEGWWEGSCTGAVPGGGTETYALEFEVRPSGYQALGGGPVYERLDIGEGDWVHYHVFGTLVNGDGEEVSSPFNANTDNFVHCVSETCSVDANADLIFTLIIDQPAMFTPSGAVPRNYLFAGSRAGASTAARTEDPPHPSGQEVSAQIHGLVVDGNRLEGPCAWQTTHIEYRDSSFRPDPPVIRTGMGEIHWVRCPESRSSQEVHARPECR